MSLALFVTALLFGLRHGIDWDHIAAISDITSSRNRPMKLSSYYALGHALVVLILGAIAIEIGDLLPPSIDSIMEHFVGATLILLAVYVFYSIIRHGSELRMRSRWMLIAQGVRRLFRHAHLPGHKDTDHHHGHGLGEDDYGPRSAFAIGCIHGIGAETPTQVLLFAGAVGAGGRVAGIVVLFTFLAGLFLSNTMVAALSTFGFHKAPRPLYIALGGLAGAFSLVVGLIFLFGHAGALPTMMGG